MNSQNESYAQMKSRHERELSEFPIAFAFSNAQLSKALQKLGATINEVTSIYGGGIVRKSDLSALNELFDRHSHELEEAMGSDDFLIDAMSYELGNHEYCITYSHRDALNALGIEGPLNERQENCLKIATRPYFQ